MAGSGRGAPDPLPPLAGRAGRAPTLFVVTEHADYLTTERRARYEQVRARLERLAGEPVEAIHYRDAGDLSGARAVVLSGSSAPWAAHDRREIARLGEAVDRSGAAVLGICAGMQLLAEWAGAEVRPLGDRGADAERGFMPVEVLDDADLLAGLPGTATVFQDHQDEVVSVPGGFRLLARSATVPVQAFADEEGRWWGTQFHPEWSDDDHPDGNRVLENFFTLARGSD